MVLAQVSLTARWHLTVCLLDTEVSSAGYLFVSLACVFPYRVVCLFHVVYKDSLWVLVPSSVGDVLCRSLLPPRGLQRQRRDAAPAAPGGVWAASPSEMQL